MIVAACAYFIWQERNNRMFANHARPPDTLVKLIVEAVRYRLMGLKLVRKVDVARVLGGWGIEACRNFDDAG
ncbi:hypothetical protein QVD17_28474 [Tagetes erecta]|uniref:Uncharacterized protein n=1 Tax=Tagetes erecta TaxID=13708 RepID=A0AAD8KAQ4_TARER|nr:hypothetical protein QVD17_28474 [Tagetes erecta]